MSDGCSVPAFLRFAIPQETPGQCSVCEHHDEFYYYGGSRALRQLADRLLREGLIRFGMSAPRAWMYWLGVRVGGAPWFRVQRVSWAFGGEHFRYSKEPAQAQP